MAKKEEVRQLLAELEASQDDNDQRRIRRELRKRGHYVSKHGKLIAGFVATRRDSPPPVVTTLRLEVEVHRRLQLLAVDEGKSANGIIEELLKKHLDELGIPSRLQRDR